MGEGGGWMEAARLVGGGFGFGRPVYRVRVFARDADPAGVAKKFPSVVDMT